MASGDAQRVWFPEMLQALVGAWSPTMTWDELAAFCARMTLERKALRASKGIQPPRIRCPGCGVVSRSDRRGITIRSALFALKSTGTIGQDDLDHLDKRWQKHRAKAGLDAFGRPAAPSAATESESGPCC